MKFGEKSGGFLTVIDTFYMNENQMVHVGLSVLKVLSQQRCHSSIRLKKCHVWPV